MIILVLIENRSQSVTKTARSENRKSVKKVQLTRNPNNGVGGRFMDMDYSHGLFRSVHELKINCQITTRHITNFSEQFLS